MSKMFKFFKQVKENKLASSIANDAIGCFVPFSSTLGWGLKEIYTLATNEPNYVDWELNSWWFTYSKELEKTVSITFFENGKKKILRLPQVLILDNTKTQYSIEHFSFMQIKDSFVVPKEYRGITENAYEILHAHLLKKNTYHNEMCIRLTDIDFNSDRKSYLLTTQGVRYEEYLRSNLTLDYKKNNSPSLRETIHGEGKLESLEGSPLANNFGVNILAFTVDYGLIIQKRGEKVAFRKGEYCPSGSGTLNNRDFPNNGEIYEGNKVFTGLIRELTEEIGVEESRVSKYELLGITRELTRGGEPEIFFSVHSDYTQSDVTKAWEEAIDRHELKNFTVYKFNKALMDKAIWEHDDNMTFESAIDECLKKYQDKISLPLITAIALWKKYILESKKGS